MTYFRNKGKLISDVNIFLISKRNSICFSVSLRTRKKTSYHQSTSSLEVDGKSMLSHKISTKLFTYIIRLPWPDTLRSLGYGIAHVYGRYMRGRNVFIYTVLVKQIVHTFQPLGILLMKIDWIGQTRSWKYHFYQTKMSNCHCTSSTYL